MASKGVSVSQLDDYPNLLHVESFYAMMYRVCDTDFSKVRDYCELHGFNGEDTIDSFTIMALISQKVHNASNTVRT